MKLARSLTHLTLATVIVAATGACATKPPPRTPYGGPDKIGAVSANMLIGHWSAKILNPIQGEQAGSTQVHYDADGTVVVQSNDTSSGMGLKFEVTGTWLVAGEYVTQTMTDLKETSGNKMAGFMANMMSSFKRNFSGRANVMEATADRVVLVSDHGQAQELTRLR